MISLLSSADLWFRTLQASTTLLLVALGGFLVLRSGVLLIGLEGQMLLSCLVAVMCAERTGSTWWALAGGVGTAVLVAGLLAVMIVVFKANEIVAGLALNVAAPGIIGMVLQGVYGHRGGISSPRVNPLPAVRLPLLDRIPWLGHVISGQTVLTYAAWIILALTVWWLGSTAGGLTVRVAGLRADALAAGGRSVTLVRCLTMLAGGALVGLGGVQLALGEAVGFKENMTSGRGFIALVLVFLVGGRGGLLLPLTVCFAWFEALGLGVQTIGLPSELSGVIPYVAVFGFLLLSRNMNRRPPAPAPLDRPAGELAGEVQVGAGSE